MAFVHDLLPSAITAMGVDAGFDMVPCLSKGAVDRHNWQSFIKFIKQHYQKDDLVEVKHNCIVFRAGRSYLLLPFEGHKFLRFCSNISGSDGNKVRDYIEIISRIAQIRFGPRVQAVERRHQQAGISQLARGPETRSNPMSSLTSWKFRLPLLNPCSGLIL